MSRDSQIASTSPASAEWQCMSSRSHEQVEPPPPGERPVHCSRVRILHAMREKSTVVVPVDAVPVDPVVPVAVVPVAVPVPVVVPVAVPVPVVPVTVVVPVPVLTGCGM